MRFSAYFIGLCVVLIAASLGAVAYLLLGLSPVEAGLVAASVMSLLTAYHAASGRAGERAAVLHQITDLSRGTADLARQVGELGRRTVAAEMAVTQVGERTRAATDPVSTEIEVLGTLVKQLAESVAAHEIALLESVAPADGSALPASSLSGVPIPPESATGPADISASPSRAAVPEERGRVATMGTGEILAVVRAALEANRVDLYLQPILTLPQRKVRYYEALARLWTEDGALILPTQYLGPAESGGLMPLLDNLMLFRSVQVVRRITAKNREVGLFCNIAESTLVDGEVFPQFFEFLNANRALAPALILQFSQRALRAMGPIEHESLAQLAQLGFRFSLDHINDLQIEPRPLAEQGFRFIKVPGTLLLNRSSPVTSDIHPSDFADLLGRYGIDLIAEKIESEAMVIDLLEYEVRFGQGFLFAPPRPIRSEIFQTGPERPPLASSVQARREASSPPPATWPRANELPAQASPTPERNAQGLTQLARPIVRRA